MIRFRLALTGANFIAFERCFFRLLGGSLLRLLQSSTCLLLSTLFSSELSLAADGPQSPPRMAQAPAKVRDSSFEFGLWVEAEGKVRPFRSFTEFQDFLQLTHEFPFSDLYIQVYRGGRSWFPSMLADDTPFYEARAQGIEPLGMILRIAQRRGQRVHAWLNVLRIDQNRDAPLLKVLGRDAVLVDAHGRSLIEYDADGKPEQDIASGNIALDTPGMWLNPHNPRVRQYVAEVVRDLLVAYPSLDGVHLDMMRYPFAVAKGSAERVSTRGAFGYSPASLAEFKKNHESRLPRLALEDQTKLSFDASWHEWQRSRVTLVVAEIRGLLDAMAPDKELSAAVLGSRDRAVNFAHQDWPLWLQSKTVDKILAMTYTEDNKQLKSMLEEAVRIGDSNRVSAGLGAWLLLNDETGFKRQVEISKAAGVGSATLFSYANLANESGKKLLNAINKRVEQKNSALGKVAPPPQKIIYHSGNNP